MSWSYDLFDVFDTLRVDLPTFMVGPEGSRLVSAYAYGSYPFVSPGDNMHTIQLDFVSPFKISQQQIVDAISSVQQRFQDGGETVVVFALFERQDFDVGIPARVCFFDYCFTPPFAGTRVLTVYSYRLWIMSYIWRTASLAVRPMIGALGIIAIAIAIVIVLAGIAGFTAFAEGKITWPELQDTVQEIIKAPGENIKEALSPLNWAGMGLGLILVGAAIVIPVLSAKVGVSVPVGQARIETEVAAGGGAAPAPPRRRRS